MTLTWAHGHRQGRASSIQGLWPAVALEADDGADNNVVRDDDGDDSDGDLLALGHDTDDDDDDGNTQLQGHRGLYSELVTKWHLTAGTISYLDQHLIQHTAHSPQHNILSGPTSTQHTVHSSQHTAHSTQHNDLSGSTTTLRLLQRILLGKMAISSDHIAKFVPLVFHSKYF